MEAWVTRRYRTSSPTSWTLSPNALGKAEWHLHPATTTTTRSSLCSPLAAPIDRCMPQIGRLKRVWGRKQCIVLFIRIGCLNLSHLQLLWIISTMTIWHFLIKRINFKARMIWLSRNTFISTVLIQTKLLYKLARKTLSKYIKYQKIKVKLIGIRIILRNH